MFGPVVRVTYGKTECINPITGLEPAEWIAVHRRTDDPADRHLRRLASARRRGRDPPLGIGRGRCRRLRRGGRERWRRHSTGRREDRVACCAHVVAVIGTAGFEAHGPGGWHRTGDLGHVDARGRLVLTGRLADVIKTGGYRVNPDEIEQCLAGMEKAFQVCITSVPSEYWGETIIAVAEQAVEGWIDEARSRVAALSRHKQPRLHLTLANLPRNPQGKVSRRQIRQVILQTCEYDRRALPTPGAQDRGTRVRVDVVCPDVRDRTTRSRRTRNGQRIEPALPVCGRRAAPRHRIRRVPGGKSAADREGTVRALRRQSPYCPGSEPPTRRHRPDSPAGRPRHHRLRAHGLAALHRFAGLADGAAAIHPVDPPRDTGRNSKTHQSRRSTGRPAALPTAPALGAATGRCAILPAAVARFRTPRYSCCRNSKASSAT